MKFFLCECYSEGVIVESDDDTVDLSFWQTGACRRTSLGHKIRHILQVLRTGRPYTDMVVLTPAEAERLGKCLIEEANRIREGAHRGTSSETQIHDPSIGERSAR